MMIGTMLAVSVLTFLLLEVNGDNVVVKVLGPYSVQEQRLIWLEENGYNEPALATILHMALGRDAR
jgi:peptide/nickel transport system permease protein